MATGKLTVFLRELVNVSFETVNLIIFNDVIEKVRSDKIDYFLLQTLISINLLFYKLQNAVSALVLCFTDNIIREFQYISSIFFLSVFMFMIIIIGHPSKPFNQLIFLLWCQWPLSILMTTVLVMVMLIESMEKVVVFLIPPLKF